MEHIIELLARHGFEDVIVTVAFLPQAIRSYFAGGETLGVDISYSVEETPRGGRVLVTATEPEALDAVHRFLRFQIEDHRTGDSLEVKRL